MRGYWLVGIVVGLVVLVFFFYSRKPFVTEKFESVVVDYTEGGDLIESSGELHSLSIESLRQMVFTL